MPIVKQDHHNEGEARTPDKVIGQVKYAEKNTAKEDGGAFSPHDEGERAKPNQDPAKKKTGEF